MMLPAITAIDGRELGVGTPMSVLQSAMILGMMAGGPILRGYGGYAAPYSHFLPWIRHILNRLVVILSVIKGYSGVEI